MEPITQKQRINAFLGKYKYPILVVLLGLGLLLLPEKTEAQPEPAPTVAEADLEAELAAILSRIDGAGEVRVLLTEEVGRQTIYQTDTQVSGDSRSDDTVLVEDADRTEAGLVRQTLEPSYRGAVVLCQGADSPGVRLAIVEAVRCVTGLGADKISVQKMK